MAQIEVEPAAPSGRRTGGRARLAVLLLTSRDLVRVVRLGQGDSVVVGRQAPADVEIPDPSLSRRHARFTWNGESLEVVDLGSTNGTHVDGKRVSQVALRQGQAVHMGAVTAVAHVREVGRASERRPARGPIIRSSVMADLYAQVDELSDRPETVFLCGERGVGKALVAATLHSQGGRARKPFRMIDCALRDDATIAAELFGDWESHTGFPGELVGVQGGTLYLVGVASLPHTLQQRIAVAITTRNVSARPGAPPVPVDARIVLGADRPLLELVGEGVLDPALVECVDDRVLSVPPLRERSMEIRPLAKCFLREAAETWSVPCPELSEDVLVVLEQYDWPGNVRQLQEVIELLALTSDGLQVELAALPGALQPHRTVPLPRDGLGQPAWAAGHADMPALLPAEDDGKDYRTRVREFEERLLLEGLRRAGGNQRAASQLLRIPLRTLAHKLKDYDLKHRI